MTLFYFTCHFQRNTEKFRNGSQLIFKNEEKTKSRLSVDRVDPKERTLGASPMCVIQEHKTSELPKNIISTSLPECLELL